MIHGDIQPETVYIDANGKLVLLDNFLLHPQHRNLLDKINQNPNYRGTLSPIQVDAMKRGSTNTRDNKFASEVWSIGITVLSYAACQRSSYFYDWIDVSINYRNIDQEL